MKLYRHRRDKRFYRRQNFCRIQRGYLRDCPSILRYRTHENTCSYLLQGTPHHMLKQENISLLRDNERLIMTLHRHWIILIFHFLYIFILVITSIALLAFRSDIMELTGEAIYWWVMSIFWIVGLTFILLDWMNDELDLFIITDTRIIGIDQVSALTRSVSECSLDRVQEVNAQTSGILETIFGFGDVHIRTASETSNMVIRYAPDPIENARRINNVISEYRNGKTQTTVSEPTKETL